MVGRCHRDSVAEHFESTPDSSAAYYFILRGADRFYSEYNAVPGAVKDHVEPDIGNHFLALHYFGRGKLS